MFVRRPQWRRANRSRKFREVGRQSIRKSFKSETCNFESNASFNKFAKSRSDVRTPANRRKDYPCQEILDKLNAVKWRSRKTIEKRIAVVESWRDKGVGKNNSGVGIKGRTNLTKLTNLEKGSLTNGRDMLLKRTITVKDNTKIVTRVRGLYKILTKRNWCGRKFWALLWGTDDQVFSFGRVYREPIGEKPRMNRESRRKMWQAGNCCKGMKC